jgi:hypothetical protein
MLIDLGEFVLDIITATRFGNAQGCLTVGFFSRSLRFFLWKFLSSILRFSALTPGGQVRLVVEPLRPTV